MRIWYPPNLYMVGAAVSMVMGVVLLVMSHSEGALWSFFLAHMLNQAVKDHIAEERYKLTKDMLKALENTILDPPTFDPQGGWQ